MYGKVFFYVKYKQKIKESIFGYFVFLGQNPNFLNNNIYQLYYVQYLLIIYKNK